MNRGIVLVGALLAAPMLVASAGVVVFNDIGVTLNAIKPPVYFKPGTNANQAGLEGTPISVSLSNGNISATITVSIPNGTVAIIDVLRIVNGTETNTTYYVTLRTPDSSTLSNYFSEALAILKNPSNNGIELTYNLLTNSASPVAAAKLPPVEYGSGGTVQWRGNLSLDFKFVPIPNQWKPGTPTSVTFTLYLVYGTSQTEVGTAPIP